MKVKEMTFEFPEKPYKADYKIILGDTLENLHKIEDEKFDLVITSPPYNVGKEYETKKSIESYLLEQERVIEELIRVTSSKGNICWQVGNYVEKGEKFPLDIFYYPIFKKHNLKLRNRIVWHFGHGLHASSYPGKTEHPCQDRICCLFSVN